MSPRTEKAVSFQRIETRPKRPSFKDATDEPRYNPISLPPPPLVHYGSQADRINSSTRTPPAMTVHQHIERWSATPSAKRQRYVDRRFSFTGEENNLATDLASIARDIEPMPIIRLSSASDVSSVASSGD